MDISIEKAKGVLESGLNEAKELLKDTGKVDELLKKAELKLKDVPVAGSVLADVPTMIAMVKGYITKSYTEVSVKVIATMVAAFIYVVKKQDLINDDIAVVGHLDDIAILAAAFMLCEPELKAFVEWRDGKAAEAKEPEKEA